MFDDLITSHQIHGLTYSEVCTLLGPDDGGNCTGFDPARAGVKVGAMSTGPRTGKPLRIVDPRPGSKCGRQPKASGYYSVFGGLAPHFMYKIRESWVLWLMGYQETHLVLIFCDEGKVDQWILETED